MERNNTLVRYDLDDFRKLSRSQDISASSTELEAEEETEKKPINYHLVTLKDIFNYPAPTYLIKPILVEGTVSVLGAYPGEGKSIVALSIIKSVLTGEPLWNKFNVLRKGPVLLVDEETPKGWLKQNVKKMKFKKDLHLWGLHFEGVRLDDDAYFDALMG